MQLLCGQQWTWPAVSVCLCYLEASTIMMHTNYVPIAQPLRTNYVPITYQLRTDYVPITCRLRTDCITCTPNNSSRRPEGQSHGATTTDWLASEAVMQQVGSA